MPLVTLIRPKAALDAPERWRSVQEVLTSLHAREAVTRVSLCCIDEMLDGGKYTPNACVGDF